MLQTRAPRHYVQNVSTLGYQSFLYRSFSQDGESRLIPYIIDYDEVEAENFFWDTDRGIDNVNNCVHSKVVGTSPLPGIFFTDFGIGSSMVGQPQGQYSREERHYQFWWHTIEDIPWLGIKVPVLHVASGLIYIFQRGGKYSINSNSTAYYSITYCRKWLGTGSDRPDMYGGVIQIYFGAHNPYYRVTINPGTKLPITGPLPGDPGDKEFGDKESALNFGRHKIIESVEYLVRCMHYMQPDLHHTGVVLNAGGSLIPDAPDNIFLFNEDITLPYNLPFRAISNDYTMAYWFEWMRQHSYMEALQSVPTLSDNSISNILEVASFIKSLVVDHRIEIPKRLQDLWLSYRYTYSTTKADVQDAIAFMKRYSDLGTLDREIKCYGVARHEFRGTSVTFRCTLSIKPRELGTLGKVKRALETYGLTPDFYVIWDMIPYSFIVDWAIPVGDILETIDASRRFSGLNYDIKNVVFSMSYERPAGRYTYKVYSRWLSQPIRSLNGLYWFDKPKASSKTKLFRILDAGSLFIGG